MPEDQTVRKRSGVLAGEAEFEVLVKKNTIEPRNIKLCNLTV